jgi:hypothetical protein
VSEFSKRNQALVPIEIASLIVVLRSATKTDDVNAIEQARLNLERKTADLNQFAEFRQLVARAHAMMEFIKEYVSVNLTSDVIQFLLKINNDIAVAMTSSTADPFNALLTAKENELTELGLGSKYQAFLLQREDRDAPKTPTTPPQTPAEDEALDFLNDIHRFIATHKPIDRIGEIALDAATGNPPTAHTGL